MVWDIGDDNGLQFGVMVDKCRASWNNAVIRKSDSCRPGHERSNPHLYIIPLIANVAQQKNALLVDHYSAVVDRWDEFDYDDVHPNHDGYEEIAKNWHNTLISLIPPSTVNMGALKLLLLE